MGILIKILKILNSILKGLLLWFTAFVTIIWLCNIDYMYDSGGYLPVLIMFCQLAVLYFICYIIYNKEDLLYYSGYHLFNRLFHLKDDIDEEDIEDTIDGE